jgi:hypothetical protein
MMRAEQPSEGSPRIPTYDDIDRYVLEHAAGKFNPIVLVGVPGLQKNRVVRDEPVVTDDVGSLYADSAAALLLKGLCQRPWPARARPKS